MARLVTIDLDIERAVVAELFNKWQVEHDGLVKLKAECSAAKHSPPDNYWHAEHKARVKYESARNFLQVLETYA